MVKKATKLSLLTTTTTLAKMGKNETVSMDVVLRICKVLNCQLEDIMEVIEV